ncbi:hypothetical protein, partial [Ornithobacterium rhinotracheale]|uniref:hypothetical protein n=1 Tax=Ornithobacterium rhinotracheale TaxID=28251 RepID=UPI0038732988
GFTSWLVIPIRANANPHMNLNDPDDAIGLLDYYNREQYGDWPVDDCGNDDGLERTKNCNSRRFF